MICGARAEENLGVKVVNGVLRSHQQKVWPALALGSSFNLDMMLEEVGLKLPEIGGRPLRWHSLCSKILTSAPMIEIFLGHSINLTTRAKLR